MNKFLFCLPVLLAFCTVSAWAIDPMEQAVSRISPPSPSSPTEAGLDVLTRQTANESEVETEVENLRRKVAELERCLEEGGRKDADIPLSTANMSNGNKAAEEQRNADLLKENLNEFIEQIISNMIPIPGKNYLMGKTEVTQIQWQAVMGNNPAESHKRGRLGQKMSYVGPNNPVVFVSWNDCQRFLEKLNALPAVKASGLVFRLPTEEEWEYACRAGATGKYCKLADGTEITEDTLGRVAWFDDNSDEKMHPVGQKEPNAFGLYDMHGNVWEWTQTADGGRRVFRGGSWGSPAGACESYYRPGFAPDYRHDNHGFRLCASGRAD